MIYFKKTLHRLLCVPFFILTLQELGRGVQWTPLEINLTLLEIYFSVWSEILWLVLQLVQKYFNRKILLSYYPKIPWRHNLGHMVETLNFKNVTSAKLWALRSTNCLFLKSTIKYLSNNGSTVLIAHVVQNL